MGVFDRFMQTRGAADRLPAENPARALMSTLTAWANRTAPSVKFRAELDAHVALANPVVYRVIDKIATSVQAVNWYAEADPDAKGRVAKKTIEEVNSVLQSPNDQMSGAQLRYWMAMNAALYGKIAGKVGIYNATPNAIYPLRPPKLRAKIDKHGNVSGYLYGDIGKAEEYASYRSAGREPNGAASKSFAFEISKPTLIASPEGGNSPLTAIIKPMEIIELLFQRALDTASGQPNARNIITSDKGLTDDQEDDIKKQMDDREVGGESAGSTLFLWGVDIKLHKLDNDISDLHTKIPADDMARHIAGAWGVPIALVGFAGADGSKFANNFTESRRSFYEDTIIPGYLVPIQEELTRYLCPTGVRIRFDLDTIPALRDARMDLARKITPITYLADDEKRELTGFEPTGKPIDASISDDKEA